MNTDFNFENTLEAAPLTADHNETRYGISLLINIPLYKHVSGHLKFIDVDKRNEQGEVEQVFQYFPRFTLMPFKPLKVGIPPQMPAEVVHSGSYETFSAPFSAVKANAVGNLIRHLDKTAKQCADTFLTYYAELGGIVIESLQNVVSYKDAKAQFLCALPLNDETVFPAITRRINSETFTAPFLDQVIAYLQSDEAVRRVEESAFAPARKEQIRRIQDELLTGAKNAWNSCRARIDSTEAQIAATPQEKKGYDMRDRRMTDAPEPLDLLCLAMLNEKPKDERQLELARTTQATQNEPLSNAASAIQKLAEVFAANQTPAQGITAAQIEAIVNERVAAQLAEQKATANTGKGK